MTVDVDVEVGSSTVLVTGSHGVLVPALVDRLLTDGHRVLVPAAPPRPGPAVLTSSAPWSWSSTGGTAAPETVEHDPEDPDVPGPLRRGVDLVLHVDTGPVGDDLATRSTAVLDALFALRVAEVNDARLVVASVDGDGEHSGTLEGLVAGYRSAHDVATVVARLTDCYGPGPDAGPTGVVARMLTAAEATGTVVVDARDHRHHTPCFVDDAVDALLVLATRAGPVHDGPVHVGPFHVGPTTALSTLELAEQVCRATGADVRVVGLAALGDPLPTPPRTAAAGTSGAPGADGVLAAWGWRPRVPLAEGLRRCVGATAGPVVRGVGGLASRERRGGLSRTGVA